MTYFEFLETKFVERQKTLNVPPKDVKVENQAKLNAVLDNINFGRKVIQSVYSFYLLAFFIALKLRLAKKVEYQSSIPPAPEKPELKAVPTPPEPPAAA